MPSSRPSDAVVLLVSCNASIFLFILKLLLLTASSSVATEWLKGKMIDDCLNIKVTPISFSYLPSDLLS